MDRKILCHTCAPFIFIFCLPISRKGEICYYRSATSKLTMENVPWHHDVKEFSEALARKSNGAYEVACEHAHSCCVLLAKVDKFKVDGQWYTWIDYEKFHNLVRVSACSSIHTPLMIIFAMKFDEILSLLLK